MNPKMQSRLVLGMYSRIGEPDHLIWVPEHSAIERSEKVDDMKRRDD